MRELTHSDYSHSPIQGICQGGRIIGEQCHRYRVLHDVDCLSCQLRGSIATIRDETHVRTREVAQTRYELIPPGIRPVRNPETPIRLRLRKARIGNEQTSGRCELRDEDDLAEPVGVPQPWGTAGTGTVTTLSALALVHTVERR